MSSDEEIPANTGETERTSTSTYPQTQDHSTPDHLAIPEAAGDGGQMAAEKSAGSLFDEIDSLKRKLSELEAAAHRVKVNGSKIMGPDTPPPADAGGQEPHPALVDAMEEHRRLEEYLYRHRREWEAQRVPGEWGTEAYLWRRHEFGVDAVGPGSARDDRIEILQSGKGLISYHDGKPYHRPNPFKPDPGEKMKFGGVARFSEEDFDAVIDYGSRRERLRQNFEWDLDRLYLEEELHNRRQQNLEKARREQGDVYIPETPPKTQEFEAQTEPLLNSLELSPRHVDWFKFMEPYWQKHQSNQDWGVVDVLLGEPVVSEGQAHNMWYNFSTHKTRLARKPPGYKAPARPTPGKDPLPERIRICSVPLFNILSKIVGKEELGIGFAPSAFVFVRPFKGLIYSQQALQGWCEALERKFSPTTRWTAPPPDGAAEDSLQSGVPESISTNDGPPSHDSSRVNQPDQDEPSDGGAVEDDNPPHTIEAEDDGDAKDDEDNDHDDVTRSVSALRHLRCLLQVLDSDIGSRRAFLSDRSCRKVWYSDLWLLFRPGLEVIAKDGKQAYRVVKVASPQHSVTQTWQKDTPFSITCVYIDFDGRYLGPVCKTFEISKFDGERDIVSLAVYPLLFHPLKRTDFSDLEWDNARCLPDHDRFRQKLILRGRKFLEVAAVKQMYYAGPTLDTLEEVESQVVVDFETALSVEEAIYKNWKPLLEELIGNPSDNEDDGKRPCYGDCCIGQAVADDTGVDEKQKAEYLDSLLPRAQAINNQPSIAILPRALEDIRNSRDAALAVSDDELVIMSYRVFGFILRNRKWAKLNLDHLTELYETQSVDVGRDSRPGTQDSTKTPALAFDRLVLQEGHQDMIVSLITQHFRDKAASTSHREQVDIVKGKGKGLIVLLHGAPGVGKTSTAGDLGTTASEVEKSLETNFALANRWGCILLLDEADVFLAQRNKEDFIRNGLVAVFLRVMEYYSGVLFLTTNRVGDFDEAFTSRIHVSLYYPELDDKKTVEVFKINMGMIEDRFRAKGRQIDIDKDGIQKFASQHFRDHPDARWNGRQIRNACQTALALAEFENEADAGPGVTINLRMKHFEKVRDAYLEFAKYINEIYGGIGARRRAKESKLRAIWVDDSDGILLSDQRSAFLQASRPPPQMAQQPVPQPNLQPGAGGYYQPPQPAQPQFYQPYPNAAPVAPGLVNPAQNQGQMYQQFPGGHQYGSSVGKEPDGASYQRQAGAPGQFGQQPAAATSLPPGFNQQIQAMHAQQGGLGQQAGPSSFPAAGGGMAPLQQ